MFQIFNSSNVRFVNKYDVFRDEVEKYRSAAKKYPLYEIVRKEIVLKQRRKTLQAKVTSINNKLGKITRLKSEISDIA